VSIDRLIVQNPSAAANFFGILRDRGFCHPPVRHGQRELDTMAFIWLTVLIGILALTANFLMFRSACRSTSATQFVSWMLQSRG
jgi:hypothetical protein